MSRFRTRPLEVEAVQFERTSESLVELTRAGFADGRVKYFGDHLEIDTDSGFERADVGDWIVRDASGSIFPCSPAFFAAAYEPVEEAAPSHNQD